MGLILLEYRTQMRVERSRSCQALQCAIRNVAGNGIAARSGFATPGPQMSKRSTVLEVEK
jgi:hypothetical protein